MITAQLGRKDKNYQLNRNEKLHPFEMESFAFSVSLLP
jgi:hypothetical protein